MQAFLITAYKNQVVKLIKSLNENAMVYVHIDKKRIIFRKIEQSRT